MTHPSLTGNKLTAHFLLQNPVLVQQSLSALVARRSVGGMVLGARTDATGSGSALFQTEDAFTDNESEIVGELAEYPLTTVDDGEPSLVLVDKFGLATDIGQETIGRNRIDVVTSRLQRLAASVVDGFDKRVLSAVGSAVATSHAATAAWGTAGADPLLDVLTAAAKLEERDKGFVADVVLLTPTLWAQAIAATKVLASAPQAMQESVVLKGKALTYGGLQLVKSTNLPAGTTALVADSHRFGSIVWEALGGGYQGDPSDAQGVESKLIQLDKRDGVRVQVRKQQVPAIVDADAAIKLTGV